MTTDKAYVIWEQAQKDRGIDVEALKKELKCMDIQTGSWAYGDSGTRFFVFKQQGMPRNLYEKIDDASQVKKYTGISHTMPIHIPWDMEDDFERVREYAVEKGIKIGAVNPNCFQENDYMLGSITNSKPYIREKAVNRIKECVDIARKVDSRFISVWFTDGTNYPGQGDFRSRINWMYESLEKAYNYMGEDMTMLIEYKLFEPAAYHTDISDWGTAHHLASKLGERAKVQIDLGHHAFGVNIPFIVAYMLNECKLGGFHINDNNCGDDDLIPGTINPYKLYLIFNEIVSAKLDSRIADTANKIEYQIDTSFCIEPKIPAMIRSVMNVQIAFAKAMLVNRKRLLEMQNNNDVLGAEAEIKDAYEYDIRPLLNVVREEMGIDPDPMKAYLKSGYAEKILKRGVGGKAWL